jgi:hypothetical protein
MKKILIIFAVFIFAASLIAQEKKYFDSPFGGGGGYVPGWFFANLDPINSQLQQINMPELTTNGFYTSGGAGFIYLGTIPGLRVGGMGFGGAASESGTFNGLNREAVFSVSGGALSIEYTLPFLKDIGISIGGLIGAGSLEIDLYSNSGSFNWDGIWTEITSGQTQNFNRTLNNSYYFFSPTLNVDVPVYRFLNVRLGVGYQITFGDSWTIENDRDLSNVPSDINGNGLFIQSGIFIGFFSF